MLDREWQYRFNGSSEDIRIKRIFVPEAGVIYSTKINTPQCQMSLQLNPQSILCSIHSAS
jgi:hypothetical protein